MAMIDITSRSGCYLYDHEIALIGLIAKQEGLKPENICAFAGSRILQQAETARAGKSRLRSPGLRRQNR